MSDLLTHIGRLEMVDVDLDLEPQCESRGHERQPPWAGYRVCAGEASHWVSPPCGHAGLRCAQRLAIIRCVPWITCGDCAARWPGTSYKIIEL